VRDFYSPSLARREKIVAEAKAAGRNALEASGDILTLMLMHRDGEWAGGDDVILNESVAYLVGSSQTTALAFTNLVIRLEQWLTTHPQDRARIQGDAEFLRRAVFESLRMTISTPVRQRKAIEDVTLSSGRTIRAGQVVSLHFIPANQDSAHFGEHTEAFDPNRKVSSTAPWGVCFSGGAHSCPGRPLVTGSRNPLGATSVDGTLATLCRQYYAVGLTLDPDHPPRRDPHTHYTAYESIPAIFRHLPAK
jgi:cytochrome P450